MRPALHSKKKHIIAVLLRRIIMAEMTKKLLRDLCEQKKLYRTPHLNDKLYLHYKGWSKIQNLEEYTGLRVIWLEGNGLDKIEGLEALKELRTLYLHENCIGKIEGLDNNVELDTLNLSQNLIKTLENMSQLKNLKTLIASKNKLKTLDDVKHVEELESLTTLDVQQNSIEDPAVMEIFERCAELRVLYLKGNPCVKKIKHYRKTTIARLKKLKYLDDRPVFPEDRERAEAFARGLAEGGIKAAQAAEKAERERQRQAKREKDEANFRAMEKMMEEGKRIREAREREEAAAAANASAPEAAPAPAPPAPAPVQEAPATAPIPAQAPAPAPVPPPALESANPALEKMEDMRLEEAAGSRSAAVATQAVDTATDLDELD